jgi:hypothetical protein
MYGGLRDVCRGNVVGCREWRDVRVTKRDVQICVCGAQRASLCRDVLFYGHWSRFLIWLADDLLADDLVAACPSERVCVTKNRKDHRERGHCNNATGTEGARVGTECVRTMCGLTVALLTAHVAHANTVNSLLNFQWSLLPCSPCLVRNVGSPRCQKGQIREASCFILGCRKQEHHDEAPG